MAMSVTETRTPLVSKYGREAEKVTLTWVSAADGSATATVSLYGWLIKAVTDPAAGGSAPTDNYDITLVQDGVDAAGGTLADRDTANNEQAYTFVTGAPTPIFLAGDHTFTIAAAGDSKGGVVHLYLVESL